jgi:exodeoxyribonuclease VII small subunit
MAQASAAEPSAVGESALDEPAPGEPDGVSTMSYEAARDELLEVVRQLEAGGLPLEQSLTLWERGEHLAVVCQSWLDGAKQRLAARRPDADTGAD